MFRQCADTESVSDDTAEEVRQATCSASEFELLCGRGGHGLELTADVIEDGGVIRSGTLIYQAESLMVPIREYVPRFVADGGVFRELRRAVEPVSTNPDRQVQWDQPVP